MSERGLDQVYESGQWQIHLGRRELLAGGVAVPVGARAFEIIEVLVQSANELVTKNDIMNRIWPGAMVGENTLQVHISAIRKAFGPDRAMLKTASGRGYRLLGSWTRRQQDRATVPIVSAPLREPAASPANNFPLVVGRLIGRAAAVRHVRDLISAYRVVTLTGPGGIGKTSLAIEATRDLVSDFDGGGWFVELASLSNPDLVPATVASAVGLKLSGEISAESVARAVGAKHLLLVLDNCEHVVDAAANLADRFVRLCPHATILVTSREVLRIDGETVYRVPPLDVPAAGRDEADHILNSSAVELFIDRSKALDTGLSLGAGELLSVGAICRQLDGIPLAIEFAAAHAATIGIQTVAIGLNDRFALLTRGRRTALPRHRTLRAVFDWSYELLSEAEQRLLRHLAIFSGGFTAEAAAAVANDGIADWSLVLESIANLVAKSLIVLDPGTAARWYLLETVRAYALEKLAGHDERGGAALRHATYFRDHFSRSALRSSAGLSADERMGRNREIDNVRSALDWCFSAAGSTAIGVDLAAGCAVWLRVDVGTSMSDTTRGALRSLDLLTKALATAEAQDDLYAQERALVGIITHHSFSSGHDQALWAAERLLRVANRIGDAVLGRNAEGLMGCALVMVGRPREAQGFLGRYLSDDRSIPGQSQSSGGPPVDPAVAGALPSRSLWLRGFIDQARIENQASTRAFLSRALWLRGFIDQARLEARASLDELPVTDLPFPLCRVLSYGACRIMPTTGDFAAAEQTIARLIEVATRINAPYWQTAGRFLSGKLMIERGEFARGIGMLNDAFAICHRTGWRISYPEFQGALATGLAGLGQLDEAHAAVSEGLNDAVLGEHGHDLYFAELLRTRGEILLRRGAVAEAEHSYREALHVARQQEALFWELRAALSLALLRVSQGRGDEARRLVAPVYDSFTEGFETPDLRAARAMLDQLPA